MDSVEVRFPQVDIPYGDWSDRPHVVIDYCQGHGEDERAEFGFDHDSDEYERRRDVFEARLKAEMDALSY